MLRSVFIVILKQISFSLDEIILSEVDVYFIRLTSIFLLKILLTHPNDAVIVYLLCQFVYYYSKGYNNNR